ncbi:EKC/KEOPS complex subunit TP53RK [Frankliniella fusca]|uniref:non-specific serine/threonine protein kinase n=1 Tax=Frankliniella fusca TaxID=407009 RepID=A0AAE1HHY4_9NEOP|nr:EKC/KEOPS complex subunit TP53RK [Frankliniella fusca]
MASDLEGFELFKQGAEGRLYKGTYLGRPAVVKERFKKFYRHPDLDEHLTKERMKAEARAIVRSKTAGVRTPCVYLVDFEKRRIYMEEIQNSTTVKKFINDTINNFSEEESFQKILPAATEIGMIVGKLHANNIIHGDLTTSNMLLTYCKEGKIRITLIDFGLSHVENSAEDKGVDLYVLERALLSTHSNAENLFPLILQAYKKFNVKDSKLVLVKLEEVRARGRKRTMVG